ncbi:hypothetical protein GCM10022294_20820 [Dietzia aurantiaca]
MCNVGRVGGDIPDVLGRTPPGRDTDEGTNMSNANDIFLQAIQPVVDIFWTMVWSATGSTISVPRPTTPQG